MTNPVCHPLAEGATLCGLGKVLFVEQTFALLHECKRLGVRWERRLEPYDSLSSLLTSYQLVIETIAATTTKTGLTSGAELDTGSYDLGISVTPADFHALPITPNALHGDGNYTLAPVPPRPPEVPASTRQIDPDLTLMLTDPALTGMSRNAFEHLVAVSEPYWDAMAEAAFQRCFHRPPSYRHPKTSSVDHRHRYRHRLLAAILRRRRAVTMTFLAQLLGVKRANLSVQYQDGKRLLDLHQVLAAPLPGSAARTMEQLHTRATPLEAPL